MPLLSVLLGGSLRAQALWQPVGPLPQPTAQAAYASYRGALVASLYQLGGFDAAGAVQSTGYVFDGAMWRPAQALALADHAMAFSAQGRAVVFGGFDGLGLSAATHTSPNPAAIPWQLQSVGASPPARRGHAMAAETFGDIVMFGGDSAQGLLGDTWSWMGLAAGWVQQSPPTSPSPRRGHAMALDRSLGAVVLFGGRDANGPCGDTWAWTGSQWSLLSTTGPSPRYDHAMATAPGGEGVVLHGGRGANGATLGDGWVLDGARWLPRTALGAGPGQRAGHGMGVLRGNQPAGDVLVLVGGDTTQGSAWRLSALTRSGVRSLGSGCATAFGTPDLTLVSGSPLAPGEAIQLLVAPIAQPVAGPVFGVLGFSNQVSGGQSLPFDLAPLGLPGCTQYVSADLVDTVQNLGGVGRWSLPVPNDVNLVGFKVYVQALVASPGTNRAGFATSSAMELELGVLSPQASPGQFIEERFTSESFLDRRHSGGSWSGGVGTFAPLGGSGELGEFRFEDGAQVAPGVYEWSTDSQLVPGARTRSGLPVTVTNGQFDFTSFVLPAGVTVRFVGSNPVVLRVAGTVDIEGELDVSGADARGGIDGTLAVIVRDGAAGGPGAARGGDGAVACDGVAAVPANTGARGGSVRVRAANAYANLVVGTGGSGAPPFPASGANAALQFVSFLNRMVGAGGGGGGFVGAGQPGRALANGGNNPAWLAPPTPGGGSMDLLNALPLPVGGSSLDHYLAGGSGGGGGGSHALFSTSFFINWYPGSGGAGGGGAIAVGAGSLLRVRGAGRIDASGGGGAQYVQGVGATTINLPQPGGGGSGGGILLQSARGAALAGDLDVRGGPGGRVDVTGTTYAAVCEGGDGAGGVLRIETPTPLAPGQVPGATPAVGAANLGVLADEHRFAIMQSRPYLAAPVFPRYTAYQVTAVIGGSQMVFGDAAGANPLVPGTGPLSIWFQAVGLDAGTGQPTGLEGPWVSDVNPASAGASLSHAGLNGFRFRLVLDRSFGLPVDVRSVRVDRR